MGALGPGWRANLTIGRALRLLVTLTGGGAPGGLDRATLGHMGKLGACIAEDEETSPWEPLHVERGFAPGASTVTLIAADAPLSISDHRSTTPEQLARCLGWAAATQWSPNWWPLGGDLAVRPLPRARRRVRRRRLEQERLRAAIFEAVQRPARELRARRDDAARTPPTPTRRSTKLVAPRGRSC